MQNFPDFYLRTCQFLLKKMTELCPSHKKSKDGCPTCGVIEEKHPTQPVKDYSMGESLHVELGSETFPALYRKPTKKK